MMKRNGFTFIEMLAVLGLLAVLIAIAVPLQTHSLHNQEEQLFIDQLEQDVLFIQNQTSLSQRETLLIRFLQDHYVVLDGVRKLKKRDYPKDWKITQAYTRDVKFKTTGTLIQPGTVIMQSPKEIIQIVFPFGKGRFYVEKEKRILDD
jgi:competence protein ComGD